MPLFHIFMVILWIYRLNIKLDDGRDENGGLLVAELGRRNSKWSNCSEDSESLWTRRYF